MAVTDQKELLARLNRLIALDYDAEGAYEAALGHIEVEVLRTRLREFQSDHRRHIEDLSRVVLRLGGTPREKPDAKGLLLKGFTAATSMMGAEAALQAMRGNERLTHRTYEKAVMEDWPDEVRSLVERNFQDERRHLAFIENALRTRSWEQPTAHP